MEFTKLAFTLTSILIVLFCSESSSTIRLFRKRTEADPEKNFLNTIKNSRFRHQFVAKQFTNWKNWKDLKFKEGDMIYCKQNFYADTVLLASSDSDVISMVPSFKVGEGTILEEPWANFHCREKNKSNCIVKYSVPEPTKTIERARKWLNKTEYFNIFTCNCEHWVTFWATGEAISRQVPLLGMPDKKCRSILYN